MNDTPIPEPLPQQSRTPNPYTITYALIAINVLVYLAMIALHISPTNPTALPHRSYTPSMLPTTATTVLQVADIPSAVAFYRDILGFTEDFRYDNYAGITLGKIDLHLCNHTIWNRPLGGGAVVIIAEEVDDYCALIRQRGANILSDPADQFYGLRDFVLADPDGNILTFSAELPTA